jgi:hypothetical protein
MTNEELIEQKLEQARRAALQSDIATAIAIFTELAEAGNAKAQHILGVFYCEGSGVPKDIERGRSWLRKAAEQGFAQAAADLALFDNLDQRPATTLGVNSDSGARIRLGDIGSLILLTVLYSLVLVPTFVIAAGAVLMGFMGLYAGGFSSFNADAGLRMVSPIIAQGIFLCAAVVALILAIKKAIRSRQDETRCKRCAQPYAMRVVHENEIGREQKVKIERIKDNRRMKVYFDEVTLILTHQCRFCGHEALSKSKRETNRQRHEV